MAQLNPQRNHYLHANLNQEKLLQQIRSSSEFADIVLWEMVELNDIYTEVKAGPITAGKLGINNGKAKIYNEPIVIKKENLSVI